MSCHSSTRYLFLSLALLSVVALSVTLPSVCLADPERMSVSRRNNYDEHVREREARERKQKYEKQKQAREDKAATRAEHRDQRRRNGGKTDDELELENFSTRTLGAACMYGAEGQVIHRPRGAWCKGDPVPLMDHDQHRSAPAAVSPHADPRQEKIRHKTPKKERCVWINGRIAFQPEGVDCYAR